MSGKIRWVTPAGDPTDELTELIRRAVIGESWGGIAATFYPLGYYGHKKACDTFGQYASASDKAQRREALKANDFNGRGGRFGRRPEPPELDDEPAALREKHDPWAGMGACFANPPLLPLAAE